MFYFLWNRKMGTHLKSTFFLSTDPERKAALVCTTFTSLWTHTRCADSRFSCVHSSVGLMLIVLKIKNVCRRGRLKKLFKACNLRVVTYRCKYTVHSFLPRAYFKFTCPVPQVAFGRMLKVPIQGNGVAVRTGHLIMIARTLANKPVRRDSIQHTLVSAEVHLWSALQGTGSPSIYHQNAISSLICPYPTPYMICVVQTNLGPSDYMALVKNFHTVCAAKAHVDS